MLPASLANPAAFFITAAVLHVIVLLGREEVLEWVKGYLLLDELGDVLAVNGGEERLELGVVDLRGDCGSRERGGEKGEVRSET